MKSETNNDQEPRAYFAKRIQDDIALTGKGDNPRWNEAHALTAFSYPWEKKRPHPTKFRALHNGEWLYCLFDVTDPDVNVLVETNDKWEVASSSRAEIFFKIDDKLTPYYCLELDPLGRVLDYKGSFYRKFNLEWTWPEGQLIVKAARRPGGYAVEVAVSKASLSALGLLRADMLQAGLYRADCSIDTDGNRDLKWISWVKPDSATPDFHIPSSFGTIQLEN